MKLLFTIWISAVLTQEVFSSALVRYPRHAVSKPTSSVHTEYEATYEQKGKHGNGSYSTVSGKQEVVHDNCHDNWNAFADKCATLIKDLVASLGNAVSSKPGDATNLQLRIRNTFKHFDSTDNCTCFTKNSLTSLFDNVTASNAHPVAVRQEIVPSARNSNGNSGRVQSTTCEGESCNEESGSSGQKVLSASQQRRGQPSLTLSNAESVDPGNDDASKESSTTNSRRGVQYPAIIVKDPTQRSRGSGAAVSESQQSSPTSGSSSNTKKILSPVAETSQPAPAPVKVIESPAEIVVPTSQSQGSTNTRSLKPVTSSRTSAPQQSSSQTTSAAYGPAKNNGIVRSAIPARPSSSASKISSPEAASMRSPNALNDAGSGSGQRTSVLFDAKTPSVVPVKPVEKVVPVIGEETPTESNAASDQTPVIAPVVLTEPVNSAAAKPQSDSSVSSGASGQIPSVVSESAPSSGAIAEPETISIKSEGDKEEDCDEEKGSEGSEVSKGSESVLAPIVPVAEPVTDNAAEPVSVPVAEPRIIKSEGDNEEDCDEEKGSEGSEVSKGSESVLAPIVPVAEPVSAGTGNAGDTISDTVAEPETVSGVKSEGDKEEDCDEEKGSESVLAPVVPVAEPVSDNAAEPVAEPVAEPETIPIKSEEGEDEDCDEEKGSEGSESVLAPIVPVAEPVSAGTGNAGDTISDTVAEPVSDNAAEPVSVPVAEPRIIKSEGDNEEDCDEEKGSEGSEVSKGSESVLAPIVPVAEPVTDNAAEPVSVPAAEPRIIKSEGDNEEDCDEEKGSESVLAPAVAVAEAAAEPAAEQEVIPIKSEGDKEEDCDEEKGSEGSEVSKGSESVLAPIVPVAEPVTDNAAEPVAEPVAEPETIPIKSEEGEDEDCDEEKGSEVSKGSESVLTPAVPVAEPETVSVKSEGDKEEECDEENGSESGQIPVVPPLISAAEPQVTSTNAKDDIVDEGASGNGSNQRPMIKPVTSTFQDPSTLVSDRNKNSASNPKSSVVPAIPVSDSGDSEMPVITQAADSTNQEPLSISDVPVPPEIVSASDTANVNPGLIVKQPQSQHSVQKNPSTKVPLINSNSNLPDSTGPVDSAGTVNPSPIYRSLPTAPSATPSSDSAIMSNKPQQSTNKQEVSKPLANERDKTTQRDAGQSISSVKAIPVAPAAASQRSQGMGGKEPVEKVFIVTPVPVYPEKVIVKSAESTEESSKNGNPSKESQLTGDAHTKPAKGGGASGPAVNTLQAGSGRQEVLLTTPIPVIPVVTKEHKGDAAKHSTTGKPSLQQHPLFTNLGNKKSAGNQPKQITGEPVILGSQSPPPKVVKVPAVQTAEDEDLTKPTTFQTTSTDPTPPQESIQSPPLKNSVSLTRPTPVPQDSFETPRGGPATSSRTPHDDDDDDEEEDCCSCESCTEEEVTNPKQYKEMACKDLEEARKELKAIFDKIKKRLKCGKKAPQKIVAS